MILYEKALAMIAETERSLRQLMSEAVESEDYVAVAQLAALAERLTLIRGSPTRGQTLLASSPSETQDSEDEKDTREVRRSGRNGHRSTSPVTEKYPRFERDGGRLVKVGWSERDQRVYEHRAPREVVMAVCEAVNKRAVRGRRFKMEEVLPDVADLKEPVPSYQAYLTLAWLRSAGVVDRDGKDGYRVEGGALTVERIESLWQSLRERSVR
jgi:hypothetical protein